MYNNMSFRVDFTTKVRKIKIINQNLFLTVFRIEAYIRCCIKIRMLNLKGLTCQGRRMNPLEHHQVLRGFKLWYH